jgi:putative ABC transport system permease protein
MAVLAPAVAVLRDRWRAALLIAVLGALAVGLLLPARTLANFPSDEQPSIELPRIPSAGPALMWTDGAQGPGTTQTKSISELLRLLSGLTWVAFGVASLSIFSCFAAQARDRAAEIGIRRAVGAGLRDTVFTLLLEAIVLAGCALVAGVAIGGVLLSVARELWPGIAGAFEAAGPIPALALGSVIGAGSLTPLWLIRSRHLVEPPDREVGLQVPTFQVAVSTALLMASAALLSGEGLPTRNEPSAPGRFGVVAEVDSGIDNAERRATVYAALLDSLSGYPGVSEVSLTSPGAGLGLGTIDQVTTDCGQCAFGGVVIRWPQFTALAQAVSADSFRAQHIRVTDGRVFRSTDLMNTARVAVVNRNLALRYFQAGQAVGRDIYLGPGWPATPYRVIGIVDDDRSSAIGGAQEPRETVYLSALQHPPRRVEVLVRGLFTPSSSDETAAILRQAIGTQGSLGPIVAETDYLSTQARAVRWFGASLGVTAILVFAMALVGVFFTMTVWAESMAWELALRRALGARKRRIAGLVVVRTAGVATGGGALGLFLYGVILSGALSGTVAHLPLADFGLLIGAASVPAVLALVAGIIPGLRVLRRPPATLL